MRRAAGALVDVTAEGRQCILVMRKKGGCRQEPSSWILVEKKKETATSEYSKCQSTDRLMDHLCTLWSQCIQQSLPLPFYAHVRRDHH